MLNSGRNPSKAAVQKEAAQLFWGTAMDPREKIRKRVMRKAQQFADKKKIRRSTSSSSTGSSSSSSTAEVATASGGVFSEETKARAMAKRCPGALSLETLAFMRRSLLVTSGEDGEEHGTKPVALLYYRNILHKKAAPEYSHGYRRAPEVEAGSSPRCAVPAPKAQEAVLGGTSWTVAQKIELASGEAPALIARENFRPLSASPIWTREPDGRPSRTVEPRADKGKSKGKGDQTYNQRDDKREERRAEKGKGDRM